MYLSVCFVLGDVNRDKKPCVNLLKLLLFFATSLTLIEVSFPLVGYKKNKPISVFFRSKCKILTFLNL